ncbi:MAG: LytTR family DNA-binding domain-containing protein [Bacteroidota bacterium]
MMNPSSESTNVNPSIRPLRKVYAKRADRRKIALPTLEGIHFEKINELVSLEAQGNYSVLKFTNNRQLLVSKTLREIEQMLNDNQRFIRIHRSFTINLDFILKYIRGKGGYVIMEDGSNVSVSVSRKQALMDAVTLYFC